jgi:PD-(D/E)XK endonuclease
VSLPIEPTAYDLVTESDHGLQRIQVKTTGRRDRDGAYVARLTRAVYDPAVNPNARGNYREAPYAPDMIDFFFVIVSTGVMYLIPYATVPGFQRVRLDTKYAAFVVE